MIYTHHVKKISFVARDTGDTRVCGYIYSRSDGTHRLFGLKTEKAVRFLKLMLDTYMVQTDCVCSPANQLATDTESISQNVLV